MTTRTGIMDLTGSGKDLAEMYETRVSGPTGTTHYVSQTYNQDLGSIFIMNANLGGLGLFGTLGANCGHKLLNGTDLGSMFCLKGSVNYIVPTLNYRFNSEDISGTTLANYASGTAVYDATIIGATVGISTTSNVFGTGSFGHNITENVNNYLSLPTIGPNKNGYTFSLWIKFAAWPIPNVEPFNGGIMHFTPGLTQASQATEISMYCNSTSGIIGFSFNTYLGTITIPSFQLNTWYHIAWTIDKNSNSIIYVNASPVSTATATYHNPTFISNSLFGAGTRFNKFAGINGWIDEFNYYDAVLNSTQISNLYTINSSVFSVNTSSINNLFSDVTPWGIYDASLWNGSTLPEARGITAKNVSSTGTITASTGSGNGASASIPAISGSTAATMTWPTDSWPLNFTICCITRYTSTDPAKRRRVISSKTLTTNNGLLGHYNDTTFAGALWGGNNKSTFTTTPDNNWLVSCVKSSATINANTVIINGIAKGTTTGGVGGGEIGINTINTSQSSDFAFNYLVVYESALTDNQLKILSDKFNNYLIAGSMSSVVLNGYFLQSTTGQVSTTTFVNFWTVSTPDLVNNDYFVIALTSDTTTYTRGTSTTSPYVALPTTATQFLVSRLTTSTVAVSHNITQSVTIPAAGIYTLTFYRAGRTGTSTYSQNHTLTVDIGTQNIVSGLDTTTTLASNASTVGWQLFTGSFIATSSDVGNKDLKFTFTNSSTSITDSSYYITGVSLNYVGNFQSGNIMTITSNRSLTLSNVSIQVLAVGGGGSGNPFGGGAGGGGAGGFVETTRTITGTTTLTVSIGAGGVTTVMPDNAAVSVSGGTTRGDFTGGYSSIIAGGGGGGGGNPGASGSTDGGSGGGGGRNGTSNFGGGAANTSNSNSAFAGGSSSTQRNYSGSGGGGGAGGVGGIGVADGIATGEYPGAGGVGKQSAITSKFYAGGGAAGRITGSDHQGFGGIGGGGAGGTSTIMATNGTANTGGGGGGGGTLGYGAGGSGVFIVKIL